MTKKEKDIYNLEQFVNPTVEIECSKCGFGTYVSTEEPEEDAYDEGWRATEKNCYCPKCAKKYLKSKQ